MLGGSSGLALADTHYFEFPAARHEPIGHECGHSARANLQLPEPTHGRGDPFFRLSSTTLRHRRRMVLTEHGDGPSGTTYDERTPYDVSATRRRETTLVLVPIR
jgi:hypothetical protein